MAVMCKKLLKVIFEEKIEIIEFIAVPMLISGLEPIAKYFDEELVTSPSYYTTICRLKSNQ